MCSINEAARRLGHGHGWLRRLLDSEPTLAALVLMPDTGGDRLVRWTALERYVAGDLQLPRAGDASDALPDIMPERRRRAEGGAGLGLRQVK